jgi:hypothetical protein
MSIFVLILSALPLVGPPKPEALLKFERARAELRTGHIACMVTGGERILGTPVVCLRMDMAKNGQVMYSFDGDEEGVWGRDAYGYPMLVGRTQTVYAPDVAWSRQSTEGKGIIAPRSTWHPDHIPGIPTGKVDLRTIGMAPDWHSLVGQEVGSVLTHLAEDCSAYTVEQEGSLHRVTIHYADDREMTYEIDAAKGWNATRISGHTGERQWETVIQLGQNAGNWFPEAVTLYVNGEPRTEFAVTEAKFNSPDDPQGWTPADIGFEPGLNVFIIGTPPLTDGKVLLWDGEKAAPYDEVAPKLRSGKLKHGPILTLIHSGQPTPWSIQLERLRSSPGVLRSFVSGWEFYTAMFVTRHGLNAEQEQRAYRVLHAAQDKGNQYLSRNAERFQLLQKQRDARQITPEEASQEFAKLREPVDEIFEHDLKPGLEKIPTRKQVEEAKKRGKDQGLPPGTFEPQLQPHSRPARPDQAVRGAPPGTASRPVK